MPLAATLDNCNSTQGNPIIDPIAIPLGPAIGWLTVESGEDVMDDLILQSGHGICVIETKT